MHRFLVVIPAYNEESTIAQVVRSSREHADVCVVDDASTDRTPQILAGLPGVHVIRHPKNTHIARAILDGMRYAFDEGYDYCITMDAGLSHDPALIPRFRDQAGADLVLGRREKKVDVPLYRKALSRTGNALLNLALNPRNLLGGGAGLRDVTSGYRMYSRDAVRLLLGCDMQSRSFDFHLEALAYVYRKGMRIAEIPITYLHTNSSLRWRVLRDAFRTWCRLAARRAVPETAGGPGRGPRPAGR